MMLKKLLSICARPGYKNPEKWLKNLSGNSPKMFINPNFASKNLEIYS